MTAETRQVAGPERGAPGWLFVSWWFIAPFMAFAALADVREHTFTRYATGRFPREFGIALNPHTDLPFMLALVLVLFACGLWLTISCGVASYLLARGRRLPLKLIWQFVALALALGLPFLPLGIWDDALLRTVGPGKAAGDMLAKAAARGDVDRLKELLARGTAVDSENFARTGDSPALWTAVRYNQPGAVAFLLERGANPNQGNPFGALPLIRAVREGDAAMVRALVAHGADSCATEAGWMGANRRAQESAWSVAQAKGQADIIAILPACPRSTAPGDK